MTTKSSKRKKQGWPRIRKRAVQYRSKDNPGKILKTYHAFTVDLGIQDGKRKTKTFKTEAEAERFAEEVRVKKNKYGSLAFELDSRQIAEAAAAFEFLNGKMPLRDACKRAMELTDEQFDDATGALKTLKGRPVLAKAATFYLKHHDLSGNEVTVEHVVEAYLEAAKEANLRPRSILDLRSRLSRFQSSFGTRPMCELTRVEIESWIRGLSKANGESLGSLSRKHYRTVIGGALNYAVDHGFISENPLTNKTKRKRRQGSLSDEKLPEILSIDQVERMLYAAQSHESEIAPALAIAFFAGVRTNELSQLCWTHIDFPEKLITVPPEVAKKRSVRHVEMESNLVEWLLPYQQLSGYIAPQGWTWRSHFDKVRELAKITEWPVNAMRHCFASNHLALHQNQNITAIALGHRDTDLLYNHYRGLVKPAQARRFFAIVPRKEVSVRAFTS